MLIWNLGDQVTSLSTVGGMPTSAFPQTKLSPQTTLQARFDLSSQSVTKLLLGVAQSGCKQRMCNALLAGLALAQLLPTGNVPEAALETPSGSQCPAIW